MSHAPTGSGHATTVDETNQTSQTGDARIAAPASSAASLRLLAGDATRRRESVLRAGLRQAWALLAGALDGLDSSLPRMRFGYAAARRLYGPDHPRTTTAAEHLALELFIRHDYDAALAVRRALLDAHTRTGQQAAAIHTRFDLGCTLHALGRCDDGIDMARDAWQDWTQLHDIDLPGLARLITVAALLRACNRPAEAVPLLEQARAWVRISVRHFVPHERANGVVLLLAMQPPDLERHHLVCAHRSDARPTHCERRRADYHIVQDDLL